MRSSSKLLLSAASAIMAAISFDTYAGTATSTLTVTASVPPVCTVSPATLAFGPYNPLNSSDVTASTTFTVTCTQNTPYSVSANTGSNASSNTRRMSNGAGAYLGYELYTDSGHTIVWDSASGVFTGVASGLAAPISPTVYGVIRQRQDVPVGDYSDTVTITVAF